MANGGECFMDDKLYEAARISTLVIPSAADPLYYLKVTPGDESNAVHVAATHGNHRFIDEILRKVDDSKQILCKRNSIGQTPLHLAAESGSVEAVEAILKGHRADNTDKVVPCWRERDCQADTPVHIALRFGHEQVALLLLENDMEYLASLYNNAGESLAFLAAENFCYEFLRKILNPANSSSNYSVSFSGPFGQTAFHPSSKLTVEIMSSLIGRRKDLLKTQDNNGKTVLHYAVDEDNMEMVEKLLEVDSSLAYLHDKNGLTPLHVAASMGSIPLIKTIMDLSPQSISISDNLHGNTALHVAKMDTIFITRCLQETRMKELINKVNYEGNTLLHLALLDSNVEIADAVLQVTGVNWKLKNMKGHTPMQLCKSENQIPTKLKYLTSSRRIEESTDMKIFYDTTKLDDLWKHFKNSDQLLSFKGPGGNSIFHIAARDGNVKTIEQARHSDDVRRMLLSQKNEKGEIPLHLAAEFGNLGVVQAIKSICTSQENKSSVGDTENGQVSEAIWKPWRVKSRNGDTPAHKAIRNGHDEIALVLLRLDPQLASDDYVNNENESLLYLAAVTNRYEVGNKILSASSQFPHSICGPNGKNPLHASIAGVVSSQANINQQLFWYPLLRKQPDLSKMLDNDGKTPLHYAVEYSAPVFVSRLIEKNKSAAFVYDSDGLTPFLRAAKCGSYSNVEQVLRDCPLSAEFRDVSHGRTPLHFFSSSPRVYNLQRCLRIPGMEKLINETDRDGNTPLHTAVLDADKAKVIALLKFKGINLKIRNKQGQTPLDLCQQLMGNGYEVQREICRALKNLSSNRMSPVEILTLWISKVTYVGSQAETLGEEELKVLLNNLALVATLLVALTFAGLFTIPGGYDQNTGRPIRIGEIAIQLFVASDAFAMLLGIGVLVRYLLIMSTGYQVSRLGIVVGINVRWLLWSINFTLVAFLCGLYALCSGYPVAFWIFALCIVVVARVVLISFSY